MSELKIEPGSLPAEKRFSITVTEKGPFLVYGRPPFCEQFIMPDPDNESWYFQEGKHGDCRRYLPALPADRVWNQLKGVLARG